MPRRFAVVTFVLGLGTAGVLLQLAPADATPGMVNAAGCHSHPRHCHSRGELRRNSRGRFYVPGHFSDGHRACHRRGRRHR